MKRIVYYKHNGQCSDSWTVNQGRNKTLHVNIHVLQNAEYRYESQLTPKFTYIFPFTNAMLYHAVSGWIACLIKEQLPIHCTLKVWIRSIQILLNSLFFLTQFYSLYPLYYLHINFYHFEGWLHLDKKIVLFFTHYFIH